MEVRGRVGVAVLLSFIMLLLAGAAPTFGDMESAAVATLTAIGRAVNAQGIGVHEAEVRVFVNAVAQRVSADGR